MSTAEDGPFDIRRADFLAVAWIVLGVGQLAIGVVSLVDSGSFDLFYVAIGFAWFVMGGIYHVSPESIRNGTDPAPRTWFELAGFLLVLAILAFAVLFSVSP
jgi:peptidoglycan/LPS O-acetylase OafA/YrhL